MKTFLIRAEDKNIWERRAPIVPDDLKEILTATNTTAFIQKSKKRFFREQEYVAAGAQLCENMTHGDIIVGIKEIPEYKLIDNKTYIFFSHTIKGQVGNMPMLKKIITGGSTLIDYEKIIDDQNRRLVFFGRYAGDAGAIDILWLMGEYWQHKGINTPFSQAKQANFYHSINEAQTYLKEIGEVIKKQGLPEEISPLVIGVLGYGNVSTGAQQIFNCLPVEKIEPENLQKLVEGGAGDPHKVYLSVFKEEHLVKHKSCDVFDLQDYYQHPEKYSSQFHQYLPYITILVNAIYWESRYPRFVTWDSLRKLNQGGKKTKLCGIADITCDVNGSIECNIKATDSGRPAYLCDPETQSITDGHKGEGIVLLAVDNLPAELPHDSSIFFSNQLKKIFPNILSANFDKPLEESGLSPEIQQGVIVYNGELTPSYRYLNQYILE